MIFLSRGDLFYKNVSSFSKYAKNYHLPDIFQWRNVLKQLLYAFQLARQNAIFHINFKNESNNVH